MQVKVFLAVLLAAKGSRDRCTFYIRREISVALHCGIDMRVSAAGGRAAGSLFNAQHAPCAIVRCFHQHAAASAAACWWKAPSWIAQDVLRVRLKAPDGRDLPRWTPGSHIDLQCGDTGISRQYSLCGDPQVARGEQDRQKFSLHFPFPLFSLRTLVLIYIFSLFSQFTRKKSALRPGAQKWRAGDVNIL